MRTLNAFIVIELGVVLLVLVVILGFVGVMPNIPGTVRNDYLCVTHGGESDPLCGRSLDTLTNYFAKEIGESYHRIVEETKKEDEKSKITLKYFVKNQFWEMKPAARYIGLSEPNIKDGDEDLDMVPVRDWHTRSRLFDKGGYKRYGVFMKNGRIVVPVTGTYYVYSNLDLFHPAEQFPRNRKPIYKPKNGTIKHALYKFDYHGNEEVELLRASIPPLKARNEWFNAYTSYMSGAVNLKAGEEIYIKISNIYMLRYPSHNYIGINMI